MIKKIIEEEEKLDLQTAGVMSIWIHNTNITIKGYSPLQLVTGKAVNIRGVINGNMADSMYDSENMKKIMTRHYEIEKKFNEIEYSTKLERAIKLNVGKINDKKYLENEKVFYQAKNEKAWKGPATVMNHWGWDIWLWANGKLKKIADSKVQPYDITTEEQEVVMEGSRYLGKGAAHAQDEVVRSCLGG